MLNASLPDLSLHLLARWQMFVSTLQLGLSTLDIAQTCMGRKSHSKSKSLFQFVVLSEQRAELLWVEASFHDHRHLIAQ